jgi:protein involved in polysaccharide export with SLBB domain
MKARFPLPRVERSFVLVRRLVAVVLPALASLAVAQAAPPVARTTGHRDLPTRADLEAAAGAAEQLARTTKDRDVRLAKQLEAARLRTRLREGDFQPGHRIYLNVEGDTALTDTFTVSTDRTIILPNFPPLSVAGILDSELEPYLSQQIARYLRNPTVHVRALMQISVSGAVNRPGYYQVATDLLVSDAIMTAGGPAPMAELGKISVRREGQIVLSSSAFHDAIRLGLTLSEVGTRPGDEIIVPAKGPGAGWTTTATVISVLSGLAVIVGLLVGAHR